MQVQAFKSRVIFKDTSKILNIKIVSLSFSMWCTYNICIYVIKSIQFENENIFYVICANQPAGDFPLSYNSKRSSLDMWETSLKEMEKAEKCNCNDDYISVRTIK